MKVYTKLGLLEEAIDLALKVTDGYSLLLHPPPPPRLSWHSRISYNERQRLVNYLRSLRLSLTDVLWLLIVI